MRTVVVIGSYNQGITVGLSQLPVWGQTIACDQLFFSHGGKGSNQAVAAARFGAPVRFCGRVGRDAAGEGARTLLAAHGIDVSRLAVSDTAATGVGVIALHPDGRNAIMVGLGANSELAAEWIAASRPSWPEDCILLAQLEVPLPAVRAAFDGQHGLRVLNPAPAWPTLKDQSWDFVDLLTPNETEAKQLAGLPADADMPLTDLMDALRRRIKTPWLIITCGAQGALLADQDRLWNIPAPMVDAVDTTGAGDVFNGILAASLAQGMSMLQAAKRAVVGASLSTTKVGVIEAIPDPQQLEPFLAP